MEGAKDGGILLMVARKAFLAARDEGSVSHSRLENMQSRNVNEPVAGSKNTT